MLEDEINAVVEDLREALRWPATRAVDVGKCIPKLEALASRTVIERNYEASRIDRIVANLRVGLNHNTVNPSTLLGYGTGAANELAWMASDLRREREKSA